MREDGRQLQDRLIEKLAIRVGTVPYLGSCDVTASTHDLLDMR